MQNIFSEHGFELSPEEMQKFETFLTQFKETNAQINLSAIRDNEGIIEKHFIDSLYLAAFYDIQGRSTGLSGR